MISVLIIGCSISITVLKCFETAMSAGGLLGTVLSRGLVVLYGEVLMPPQIMQKFSGSSP